MQKIKDINEAISYLKQGDILTENGKNNFVFISEQAAPHDFEAIWTQEVKRTTNKENNFKAVEHLYVMKET